MVSFFGKAVSATEGLVAWLLSDAGGTTRFIVVSFVPDPEEFWLQEVNPSPVRTINRKLILFIVLLGHN